MMDIGNALGRKAGHCGFSENTRIRLRAVYDSSTISVKLIIYIYIIYFIDMRFTLKQLQVFLAVANHENVTLAAVELAMSQSAASTALKQLEKRFDVNLFDRIGKRLQLNEQGIALRPKVLALISRAEELESSLIRHNEIAQLKVGATLTIGNYLAVEIMAKFMQQYPAARVELDVENTAAIAAKAFCTLNRPRRGIRSSVEKIPIPSKVKRVPSVSVRSSEALKSAACCTLYVMISAPAVLATPARCSHAGSSLLSTAVVPEAKFSKSRAFAAR